MSEHTIDPTRQGVTHQPEAEGAIPNAELVTVERALAAVEGWRASGMPLYGLHQIAVALAEELVDLRRTFDLRWDADMRAIKRWQAEKPGRELIWPDHADMVVWLLDQDATKDVEIAGLRAYRDSLRQMLGQAIEERERLRRQVHEVAAAAVTCGDRLDWLACRCRAWFPCCVARDKARVAMGMEPVWPDPQPPKFHVEPG